MSETDGYVPPKEWQKISGNSDEQETQPSLLEDETASDQTRKETYHRRHHPESSLDRETISPGDGTSPSQSGTGNSFNPTDDPTNNTQASDNLGGNQQSDATQSQDSTLNPGDDTEGSDAEKIRNLQIELIQMQLKQESVHDTFRPE